MGQKAKYYFCVFSTLPQTDVQKILRNARKLPEKTLTFYKVSGGNRRPMSNSYSTVSFLDWADANLKILGETVGWL